MTQPSRAPSPARLVTILTVITAILFIGAAARLLRMYYSVHAIPFDSTAWRASKPDHSHDSLRLRMVDNLLASHPLTGLTRAQVEALLGPATQTDYFPSSEMVYYLGLERSGITSIDSEWLVIDLDDQGLVTDARLARD